jgi:hypothetical protein
VWHTYSSFCFLLSHISPTLRISLCCHNVSFVVLIFHTSLTNVKGVEQIAKILSELPIFTHNILPVKENTYKMLALRLNLTVKENKTINHVKQFSYDVSSNVVNIIILRRTETCEFIYQDKQEHQIHILNLESKVLFHSIDINLLIRNFFTLQ